MSRVSYVNGRYMPHRCASVHIEDRGYQFADGVYEVIAVWGGRLIDEQAHLARLARSLAELRIRPPMSEAALRHVIREVVRRNRLGRGAVYLQVTRGVARRDHTFPPADVPPSLVVTAHRPRPSVNTAEGGRIISIPDLRWKRCDIKSIALLANVLGKQRAKEAGAFEAWMIDEAGNVTEGTASNAWIVTAANELVTPRLGDRVLSGVTRSAVAGLAKDMGLKIVERSFSLEEAKAAREAFVTGTTSLVTPVVRIDDAVIADGRPGQVALRLRAAYEKAMMEGLA